RSHARTLRASQRERQRATVADPTRPSLRQRHSHFVSQRSEEISGVKELAGCCGPFACETPVEETLGGLDDEGRRERVDVPALCGRAAFTLPAANENVHHELLGGAAALVGGAGWRLIRVGQIPERRAIHVRTDVAGPKVM